MQTVGVGVAALAAHALVPGTAEALAASASRYRLASARPPADTINIGVLLPDAGSRGDLGTSLLAGMELYLIQTGGTLAGRAARLETRRYGTRPARANVLGTELLAGGASVVTGLLSRNAIASLRPLLAERHTPLVVADIGANAIRHNAYSPYVFRNALSFWQSGWAFGHWAATQLGRRATIVSAFYESGYDALFAFRHGFEQAGGEVVATHVTHRPDGATDLQALLGTVHATGSDFVYLLASGSPAGEFARAYAEAGLAGRVPLAGAAWSLDEALLAEHGPALSGALSALPWSPALDTAENQAFTQAYATYSGRAADAGALLGYDTARMLDVALQASDGETGEGLRAALGGVSFRGPRGDTHMHPELLEVETPIYVRQVQTRAGQAVNSVLGRLPGLDGGVTELLANTIKTGWTNAYLCI